MREWFLEQLSMYAAYHRDKRNQATHHVGVPLIVFALLVAMAQVPLGLAVAGAPITLATVFLAAMMAFYLFNVPVIGFAAVLIYGVLYAVAERIGAMGPAVAWSTFGSAFVGGWIIQFAGHAFEGRRPAFLTNAVQIFMAPPFLIAEIMFAFGLERDLAAQIESRAVKYLPGEG